MYMPVGSSDQRFSTVSLTTWASVLPESAFCHAVLEELLQIVGIGLGHPPVAVLMGLALRKEPQRRERDGSFYRFCPAYEG